MKAATIQPSKAGCQNFHKRGTKKKKQKLPLFEGGCEKKTNPTSLKSPPVHAPLNDGFLTSALILNMCFQKKNGPILGACFDHTHIAQS